MTDKQVMIDGVDVNGCISLDKYHIPNCTEEFIDCALGGLYEYQDEYKRTCKENPNCYYKQLARKEQECEELKKELAKVYEDIKLSPLCYKCDEEECLRKEIDELKTENRKLKQTLTEIKELLLKTPTDSQMHCVNAKSIILQKIKECETE